MARGKSYEGEDFTLSWKITLQVHDKSSALGKGKGPKKVKIILNNIGAF